MADNTKKTSAKSAVKSAVSRFQKATKVAKDKKKSSFFPVNEEKLSSDDIRLIKSAVIVKTGKGKDGQDILKCRITYKDGDSAEFPLQRSWEFERGDSLILKSLTLCNLEDADGNLKEDDDGNIIDYIYGDVE